MVEEHKASLINISVFQVYSIYIFLKVNVSKKKRLKLHVANLGRRTGISCIYVIDNLRCSNWSSLKKY